MLCSRFQYVDIRLIQLQGAAGKSRPQIFKIRSPRPMPDTPVRTVSGWRCGPGPRGRPVPFLHPGEFDGVGLVGHVDDAAAEDVGHALHFLAFLAHRAHLDQHQLALDVRAFGQVDHLHHVHQAVQVLGDLLDDFIRAGGDDGHARQRGVLGRRDGQRLDVVARAENNPTTRDSAPGSFSRRTEITCFMVASLQVFRAEQHFGQPAAGLHHGPHVLGAIGDEVQEDQAVLVLLNASRSAGSTSAGRSMRRPTWP